jgi:hypothetical protein
VATNLHRVRLNFVFRLEAISPTDDLVDRGFRNVDRLRLGADEDQADAFGNESGRARDFVVKRLSSGEDHDPSRNAIRECTHEYEIVIAYPTCLGLEHDIHEIMDRDRHDMIEALRDKPSYTGIPGDASAATGLMWRRRLGDALEDDGAVWRQVYRYAAKVREDV